MLQFVARLSMLVLSAEGCATCLELCVDHLKLQDDDALSSANAALHNSHGIYGICTVITCGNMPQTTGLRQTQLGNQFYLP